MRKEDLLHNLKLVALADGGGTGGPFPDAIHREDNRFFKGRREEGAGRVALMVLGKQQPVFPIEALAERFELVVQESFLKQFFTRPQRHRHAEGTETTRREREICFHQAFEFQKRLVIEDDVVQVFQSGTRL